MGLNIQKNVPLANYTTFGIGGPARYFFEAKTAEDIKKALNWAKKNSLPYFILGGGSNLLVSDKGFDGLVIKIQNSKFKIQNYSDFIKNPRQSRDNSKCKIIKVEAGVLLSKLVSESINNGLRGIEWAVGIPGTIGGAVCGNAGAYGHSISESISNVTIMVENGEIHRKSNKECQFGYRESIFKKNKDIILTVELRLVEGDRADSQEQMKKILLERRNNVPSYPSAGSVFKNIFAADSTHIEIPSEKIKGGKIPASYLIEQCGLKGEQIGGAKISEQHANFIINIGGAKASDVLEIVELCKEKVKEKFRIVLEEEIKYLGF